MNETAEILDHQATVVTNDIPTTTADEDTGEEGDQSESPRLGYDDATTGEKRSHRTAAKRRTRGDEDSRNSYYVKDTYEGIAHMAGHMRGGSRRRS